MLTSNALNTLSFFVSVVALCASVYASFKANRANESQVKLNKLLLEKRTEEVKKERQADLGASFIKIGNQHKLKIFNKGPAVAKNIRIEILNGDNLVLQQDLEEKFPMQTLEKHGNVELIALIRLGSKSKYTIKIIWDDELSINNEKLCYPTI